MIPIVQVYRYQTNNGCSVRVGWGVTHDEPLKPQHCVYFEFVESPPEVKAAIRLVRTLPKRFRNRDEALDTLRSYLTGMSPHCKILVDRFTVSDVFRPTLPRIAKRH